MHAAADDRQNSSHVNNAIAYAMTIVHPVESILALEVVYKIERIVPDKLEHSKARRAIITASHSVQSVLGCLSSDQA